MVDNCFYIRSFYTNFLKFVTLLIYICFHLAYSEIFTSKDYYESFSSPKECFQIYHNNPTGPHFLLFDVIYNKLSNITGNLSSLAIRKYQLKRLDIPCQNSFTIPAVGKRYLEIRLAINISLYYIEESIATFLYSFNCSMKNPSLTIISLSNSFGLLIKFSDTINENFFTNGNSQAVQSYLYNNSKTDNLICVITQNNPRLILEPTILPLMENILVTGIRVENIQNEAAHLIQSYPAFGCYQNNFLETVYLIHEVNVLKIRTRLIYRKIDETITTYHFFRTNILNIKFQKVENIQYLPKNVPKLFCLKINYIKIDCPDKIFSVALISESKYIYHGMTAMDVDVTYGVRRRKRFPYILISPSNG